MANVSDLLLYARDRMKQVAPWITNYEDDDTITVPRMEWNSLVYALEIYAERVRKMEEQLSPPDSAEQYKGENIINFRRARAGLMQRKKERKKTL